jgi:hypothetical protein
LPASRLVQPWQFARFDLLCNGKLIAHRLNFLRSVRRRSRNDHMRRIETFGPIGHTRSWVAENAATPPEILVRLAQDVAAEVRWMIAGNAATPTEILARLAQDTDSNVCFGWSRTLRLCPRTFGL